MRPFRPETSASAHLTEPIVKEERAQLDFSQSMNYGDYSYVEWYENGGSNMLPVPGVPRRRCPIIRAVRVAHRYVVVYCRCRRSVVALVVRAGRVVVMFVLAHGSLLRWVRRHGARFRFGWGMGVRAMCTGAGSGRNRRSRRLLVTTNTDDSAMAAAATSGFSSPAMAIGMAATL